ncbi:hypothetical protein ACRALDRAFT_212276 [Sodiomyces alcalophilus JCM 7366]|uniref:uncharacterized protein n=1 Tax=Sodiomyces alcalophilus JCM 7366 TaxID=591952 RepID=UPI0039B53A8E
MLSVVEFYENLHWPMVIFTLRIGSKGGKEDMTRKPHPRIHRDRCWLTLSRCQKIDIRPILQQPYQKLNSPAHDLNPPRPHRTPYLSHLRDGVVAGALLLPPLLERPDHLRDDGVLSPTLTHVVGLYLRWNASRFASSHTEHYRTAGKLAWGKKEKDSSQYTLDPVRLLPRQCPYPKIPECLQGYLQLFQGQQGRMTIALACFWDVCDFVARTERTAQPGQQEEQSTEMSQSLAQRPVILSTRGTERQEFSSMCSKKESFSEYSRIIPPLVTGQFLERLQHEQKKSNQHPSDSHVKKNTPPTRHNAFSLLQHHQPFNFKNSGLSQREVGIKFNISPGSVSGIARRYESQISARSRPRSGRPQALDTH